MRFHGGIRRPNSPPTSSGPDDDDPLSTTSTKRAQLARLVDKVWGIPVAANLTP
ncbi:MAG: hypothetical protein H6720_01635 [Sandaracinus sp.]|nr:hypothetical protein [Sandaracinus sp.]